MNNNGTARHHRTTEQTQVEWMFHAKTPLRKRAMDLARRVAESNCPILILGPTGVGKEVLATDIHRHSSRRDGPFVTVNCAAFAPNLFESAFFGHLRGAFTGATMDKLGLVELARGGTLFLDEVGDLPAEAQAKLLRFIANGTFWPVGATSERHSDVRIISATHRPIDSDLNDEFRKDLFFRLSVVLIRIPQLEAGDIAEVAKSLAIEIMPRYGQSLSSADLEVLGDMSIVREWKGSVRELRNAIERLLVLYTPEIPIEDQLAEVFGIESNGVKSGVRTCGGSSSVAKDLDNLVFLGLARECTDVRELAERTDRTVQAVYGRLNKLGLGPQDLGQSATLEAVIRGMRERITPEMNWIQQLLVG
jgi:DNA-binding NtrC family response regulator